MKKTLTILTLAAITTVSLQSCNNNREPDYAIQSVEKIKTDSVKIVSDTMLVNSIQSIRTYSTYNFGCEGFYDYNYVRDNFTRTVTTYKYKTKEPCAQTTKAAYSQFNFSPQEKGTYTFKFWNGTGSSGDLWITKTIVVE